MTDPRVRNEWASYLHERPLLLANLGHLARQTFRFFEESDFSLDEAYQNPSSTSLLHQVQRDILEFQMPEKKDIKEDESLSLYSASSKRREVEILYDTLLERMKKIISILLMYGFFLLIFPPMPLLFHSFLLPILFLILRLSLLSERRRG